jgi:AcrR family transcriptional regulator
MKRAEVMRDYGGVSAGDRRTERRRKLLTAARQIWGTSGVTEVTVRGVCSAAGLTTRYFYEQFSNRDALLYAVADDVRDELLAVLVEVGVGHPGSLTDKLRSALTAFLEMIAADPDVHRIATGDVSSVPGLAAHRAGILGIITELIVEHAPKVLDGETPEPNELRRGALFMVGGVNNIIETWLADPVETPAELAVIAADLCIALVDGIGAGSTEAKLDK